MKERERAMESKVSAYLLFRDPVRDHVPAFTLFFFVMGFSYGDRFTDVTRLARHVLSLDSREKRQNGNPAQLRNLLPLVCEREALRSTSCDCRSLNYRYCILSSDVEGDVTGILYGGRKAARFGGGRRHERKRP